MIGVTAWGYVPSTPTPVAPTRRLLTRFGVHLKRHLSDDCTHDTILQMVFAAPTGGANLLSLGLKCLDMPVPCARVRLPRGEIERCKSRSSRQSPAHAPRPPCSYCSRKRHESAMNSVRGRGGSNGSAASGKRESHEGRVLCPFDFSDQTRCASRGILAPKRHHPESLPVPSRARRKDLPVASPCHPERSEGPVARGAEMLRCAQHDKGGGPFLPHTGEGIPLGHLCCLAWCLLLRLTLSLVRRRSSSTGCVLPRVRGRTYL